MLKIKDMNLNNVIRQGDSQPREYQLDTGNLNLNLTNKSATIRLMTADFQGIGYETTATVSSENKISFSIDDVIPARQYRLEVTVDDYVFPSRALDGQFNVDPSSHGQEVNIIQVIGKDEIVREVKEQIEPFLGEVEQAELDRRAQEEARETAEATREEAEDEREATFASYGPTLDAKADKSYVDAELEKKANKKQEEWITPTLLNGWTHHSGNPFKYYKDEFGNVHLQGRINPGGTVGGAIALLPIAYRPKEEKRVFSVDQENNVSLSSLRTDGQLIMWRNPINYMVFDGAYYKV